MQENDIQIPECAYHNIVLALTEEIFDKIENNYDWQFFDLWIRDDTETNFGKIYRDTFHYFFDLYNNTQFTEEQLSIFEKKGRNLEQTIGKWLDKWTLLHPNLPNQKMPLMCLKYKIHEYIAYQLRQKDMRQIVGKPC